MEVLADRAPRVSVVVLSWNREASLRRCLESLQRADYPDLQVVVADNGSKAFNPRTLEAEFAAVHWILFRENLGVAGARNAVLKELLADKGTEFILFLDDDAVVHPRLVRRLVGVHDFQRAWDILQPAVYEVARAETPYALGGHFSRCTGRASPLLKTRTPEFPTDEAMPVDFAYGFGLFTHRTVFEAVGLFDEAFSPYFGEDIDFCLRARDRNYGTMVVPDAILWRDVSDRESGKRDPRRLYCEGKGRIFLLKKHARLRHWIVFLPLSPFVIVGSTFKELSLEGPVRAMRLLCGMLRGLLSSPRASRAA